MTNNISQEQVKEAANRLSSIMKTIELQKDLIDFVPGPHRVSKDEILMNYTFLNRALTNIHELNQDLVKDMDDITVLLDDIAESMEK